VESGSAGWALRLKEDQRKGSSLNGFKADEADVKIAAITNGLSFLCAVGGGPTFKGMLSR